jgi:hypothetical protein
MIMRAANMVSRASVGLFSPWSMIIEIVAASITVAESVRTSVP